MSRLPATEPAPRGRVSQLVSSIDESPTLALNLKIEARRRADGQVIDLGTCEPDSPTPQHIVEAAVAACPEPRFHHYTPSPGLPELREAIAAKTRRDSGLEVQPAQVLVTNGGKQAVYEAFATLLDPGDEVLLPKPYWTTYPEAITLAGGVPVEVSTDETNDFLASVEALDDARTSRTKALIFCSPSNPTGSVYPRDEVEAIGRFATENNIWVVADESYEHFVYGGAEHVSMPVAVPDLANQCVIINSTAKAYAMSGWRVGWMVGPHDVVAASTRLHSHLSSNVTNLSQAAALAALSGDLISIQKLRTRYDANRRMVTAMFDEISDVTCVEPLGAFYCYPSVHGLLGKSLRGRHIATSRDLAEIALDEVDVAVMPGEAFGTPGYIRLSFAVSDEDLADGIERLTSLLAETS